MSAFNESRISQIAGYLGMLGALTFFFGDMLLFGHRLPIHCIAWCDGKAWHQTTRQIKGLGNAFRGRPTVRLA